MKRYYQTFFILYLSSALQVSANEKGDKKLTPHYPTIRQDKPMTVTESTADQNEGIKPEIVEVEAGQEVIFKKEQKKN